MVDQHTGSLLQVNRFRLAKEMYACQDGIIFTYEGTLILCDGLFWGLTHIPPRIYI